MKIRDVIRKYIEYSSKKIEPYSDWSYIVDEYNRWLEIEVEIKKGEITMGLFNLIKLANDYNKAKKYLKTRKEDLQMVKDLIEKVKKFLVCVTEIKNAVVELINNIQTIIKELEKEVKGGK